MRIAIHQSNLCPWVPFFYKMARCDKFVILTHVQFEKNGYQNRFKVRDKWITYPVKRGTKAIEEKEYYDGQSVVNVNLSWIYTIRATLGISTEIVYDFPTVKTGTERLIEIIKRYGGDRYVTNPNAKDKYLDEEMMRSCGIEIEYCQAPKHLEKSLFEALEEYGIENLRKQLHEIR